MAVLFHDGLDHYGAGAIPNSLVQSGGFVASGYSIPTQTITLQESYARYTAAISGSAISLGASFLTGAPNGANNNNPIWIKRAVPTWQDKLVFGFALRLNVIPSIDVQVLELNPDLQITIQPNLKVKVFNKLADYKLEVGVYYFFEIQIDTAGNGTFWISNNQVAGATGLSAVVVDWHLMAKVASVSIANVINVDDIYLLDGSGTTNTSRLGRTNSILRIPTVTVEAGFSVSSGSALNNTYVNKTTPTGDTSYVKSNKAVRDLYGNAAPMLTDKPIKAVTVITNVRREDADDFKVIPLMKSGATVKDGAEYSLTQYNYTGIFQVYEADPATNAAWLYPALLAASWGQRLKPPVITP